MIFIVFNNFSSRRFDREGYYYRKAYPTSNPLVKASNIESMPESEQLELFQRIDKECAYLYVFGGDRSSLLREIFIKPHLDDDGYIRNTDTYKPMKTEYKGITFEYILTYDIRNMEELERFKEMQKANDMLDDEFLKIVENMNKELGNITHKRNE